MHAGLTRRLDVQRIDGWNDFSDPPVAQGLAGPADNTCLYSCPRHCPLWKQGAFPKLPEYWGWIAWFSINVTRNWPWHYLHISMLTRLTWRVCEQCLRIEDEQWRLSWVSPTLRRPQQLDKVHSSWFSCLWVDLNTFFVCLPLNQDERTTAEFLLKYPTIKSVSVLLQVSKRLWKHCWTLSWPGLREVLPPSGIL